MKEQYDKVIEPQDYPLACIDCATHMILDKRLLVKRDEYDRLKEIEAKYDDAICAICNDFLSEDEVSEWKRLKRLGENVKSELKRKKELLDEAIKECWISLERAFRHEIELLESLDK